jgi:sugar transferase (PEP-CTERM/EpsH1 system associated)
VPTTAPLRPAPHAQTRSATRLRVQHVVLSLQPGGLENGVVNVINGLDRERFESSVCCLKRAGEFARRIADPHVLVHEMGWIGGNDLRLPFRLARLFRENETQIVHTRNAEAFFYGFLGAKLAGVPAIVHSEHGRTFDERRVRFAVQRLMTRFTNAVFAVSAQLKADLVRHVGIPDHAIDVLYNGVDLERFGQAAARDQHRAAWGVATGDVVIGSVGRLVPVKNYGLLLRAVAHASMPAHVVLVGDGPEMAQLQAQAQSLGIAQRVHLLGHCDHVHEMLSAFDVFVLPSLSEGMSNTLLEAMAARVPPVVSDVGGNREIVREGVDGLVFASGDQAVLTSHLRALCADAGRRARIGSAARERVLADFDVRAMVQRYEQLYQRVIARSAA